MFGGQIPDTILTFQSVPAKEWSLPDTIYQLAWTGLDLEQASVFSAFSCYKHWCYFNIGQRLAFPSPTPSLCLLLFFKKHTPCFVLKQKAVFPAEREANISVPQEMSLASANLYIFCKQKRWEEWIYPVAPISCLMFSKRQFGGEWGGNAPKHRWMDVAQTSCLGGKENLGPLFSNMRLIPFNEQ